MDDQQTEVDQQPEPQKFLSTGAHCDGCRKLAPKVDLANFVILFWDGFDAKTGEPIVRDGVFDEQGRVAILKACPSCGPKIKRLHAEYTFEKMGQCFHLNDGPLKHMLREIWPRRKAGWKFEIGWQLLLPILAELKSKKMRQRAALDKDNEKIDRMLRVQ